MNRYQATFETLAARGEGAFIPFVTLGDPDRVTSGRILATLLAGGADGLELGLPFSDPVADGPVIQAAAGRALAAGIRVDDCWALVRAVRAAAPKPPIGLLVYANLVLRRGLDRFYSEAAGAGADSVLIADLPVAESGPFVAAASGAGVAPVFIVPPNVNGRRLAAIARASRGYTYVTTRAGVTGEDDRDYADLRERLALLRTLGAAPPVLGFGISTPAQVRSALAAGAAGAIAGSAVVRRIAEHVGQPDALTRALAKLVGEMKAATRP